MSDFLGKIFEIKDLVKAVDSKLKETIVRPPLSAADHVRASRIMDLCPREEALCSLHGLNREFVIPAKLARTLRFGRVFEKMFRDEVLADLGVLIGRWKCQRCEGIPESDMTGRPRYVRPKSCPDCGFQKMDYVEEFKLDKESMVGGSNDGFLYWNYDYAILEMKTCANYFFEDFKRAPSPTHVAQAQIYMHLHGYRKAVIWYFNKDSSAQAVHWIDADRAVTQRLLDKGRQVKHFFSTGTVPRRICSTIDCARAKKCSAASFCFGAPDHASQENKAP